MDARKRAPPGRAGPLGSPLAGGATPPLPMGRPGDLLSEAASSATTSLALSPVDSHSMSSMCAEEEAHLAAAGACDPDGGRPDAKSSALKALAGINRVVSRSRKVDAEALQAIKAHRAKVKAEGGHRHSRTLSSDSLPPLPELHALSPPHPRAQTSLVLPPGLAGTGSAFEAAGPGGPGVAPGVPLTSPRAYVEWLAARTLPQLLALQSAVDAEITRQLSGTRLGSGPVASDALLSAQYAAALLAAQRQQQRDHAAALQQALAAAAATRSFDGGQRHAGMPPLSPPRRAQHPAGGGHFATPPLLHAAPATPPDGAALAAHMAFSGGRHPLRPHAGALSLDAGMGMGPAGLDTPPDHLLGDLHAWLVRRRLPARVSPGARRERATAAARA